MKVKDYDLWSAAVMDYMDNYPKSRSAYFRYCLRNKKNIDAESICDLLKEHDIFIYIESESDKEHYFVRFDKDVDKESSAKIIYKSCKFKRDCNAHLSALMMGFEILEKQL